MNINEKNFVFPEYSKASNISEFHRDMLKLDHYLNLGMDPKKFNSVLKHLSVKLDLSERESLEMITDLCVAIENSTVSRYLLDVDFTKVRDVGADTFAKMLQLIINPESKPFIEVKDIPVLSCQVFLLIGVWLYCFMRNIS